MLAAYEALKSSVYSALVTQTRLAPYLDAIELVIDENGVRFDAAVATALVQTKASTDAYNAVADLIDLKKHVDSALDAVGWEAYETLNSVLSGTTMTTQIQSMLNAERIFWVGATGTSYSVTGTGASVVGNANANTLTGSTGNDSLYGLAGNDTISAYSGTNIMDGGDGDDVITGTADYYNWSANTLLGGAGNDTLSVDVNYTDNNVFDGGTGTDSMSGGRYRDTYRFNLGGGLDTVIEPSGVAAGYNDKLIFGAGIAPTDITVVRSGNSLLFKHANGVDQVTVANWFASSNYWLETVEFADGTVWNAADIAPMALNLISGTTAADILVGTANGDWLLGLDGNDTLDGASGNDRLDGGIGADTMRGGLGDDTYEVENTADLMMENTNEGMDTVRSVVTWTLASNIEDLVLTGTGAVNATGNTLANRLWGNDAANRIDGGTGIDTMTGGGGNDTYVIDNALDTIAEAAGGGSDTVEASISHVLAANVENLTLTGTMAINATGNDLDNLLTGNAAINTLSGGAGDDMLNGGAGSDRMAGGLGNDNYVVDNTSDIVTEAPGEGTDTVTASVTWTLGTNVENLTLIGSANLNGTGNDLDNVIVGNAGNNSLSGGAGNDLLDGGLGTDTMTGGTGNDIYRIDSARDKVTENAGAGIDRIESKVTWTLGSNFENLTLIGTTAINGTGNTLDNVLTGNVAANVLSGSSGNDTLDGGAGNDTLVGGSGADTYRFAAGKGVDTVQENDGTSGVSDRVDFGTLLQSQLAFQRSGNNLEASIVGSNVDKLVVKDWYLGTQYRVEQFAFADGAMLSDVQVQSLVDAMAVFAPGTASVEPVLRLDTSYSMSRDMGGIAAQVA